MIYNKDDDVIYTTQNGAEAAQLTLIPKTEKQKRIGAAAGKFTVPEDFNDMDKDIEDLFEGYLCFTI